MLQANGVFAMPKSHSATEIIHTLSIPNLDDILITQQNNQINCIYQKSFLIGSEPIRKSKLPSPLLLFNVSMIFLGLSWGPFT